MAFAQKQLVPVQFGGGINTKADPKQLQAGELLELENGVFSKTGQINKRYGYDALSNLIEGGGSINAGVELAVFKDELVLFDGTNVYTYISTTGKWSNRGTAISLITEDKSIIRNTSQQLNPDMAYAMGIEVYTWEDSRGGIYYSVLDTSTKAFVVSGAQLAASGQQPKCVTFNGSVYIFYENGATLYYQIVGPLNPSVVQTAVAVATDGYTGGTNGFPFDVEDFTSSANEPLLAIAYINNTPAISLFRINVSGAYSVKTILNSTLAQVTTAGKHGSMSVFGDSKGTVWTSWSSGAAVFTVPFANYGAGGASAGTQATVIASGQYNNLAATENYTAGQLLLFCELNNASSYLTVTKYASVTTAGVVSSVLTLQSVGLASKPWNYGGKIFLNTAYQSTLQATVFTWYVPPTGAAVIVAKCTPSVSGGLMTNGMCPEIVQISSGIYKFANLVAGKLISEANTLFSLFGVNSTKLTHSPTDNFINTVQGNTLLIVGGILQGYDGTSVTEVGFNLFPEAITLSAGGSDGGQGAGTYQYIVQYEWTDNNGQIYRSAPSVPKSITVSAAQHVVVGGINLTLTSKVATQISIVIYRTLVNGSNFYRVTSTAAPTANAAAAGTWSFTDLMSDASAQSNDLNYTTGGILANIAPPANAFLTTYNNRVVLGGLSDKNLLWYSQTTVDNSNANTVPPQFCQELTIAVDPRGGNVTALGLLNQTLIMFKSGNIYAISGNGPDATGANNDYGDPQLISSDVGCVNPNSVVITSIGLLFQSSRGIYLLDQSLNASYIGAPVEAFNTLNITSSAENAQDSQIIFCTSNGRALVYDYYFKQWSTWTNHYANDVVIYKNLICFVTPSGQVYLQNRAKFTDAGSPVYLKWTLPNLAFAGIQGYQRVFRMLILGTYKGVHTLNVNVAYDYADNYTQTAVVAPTAPSFWGSDQEWGWSTSWGGNSQLYEYRVDFKTQKCTAIRVSVSDNQASSYNEGYAISSVVFEVGALPGPNRLPATQTYGAK